MTSVPEPRVRVDKWLWAARFYKTRALATEAVNAGHVHVNGVRTKPARAVRVGDRLQVRKGPYAFVLTVRALSDRRGPASVAQGLYEEEPQSVRAREELAAARRLQAAGAPDSQRRPDKRSRRRIIRFRREASS